MQLRRLALHGLLVVAVGLVLIDVFAPGAVVRILGGLLTDPAHRLRDAHVVIRTCAIAALVAWAFGRFGVVALAATPLLIGPLFVAQLPPVTGDEPHYLMIDISLQHDHDFAVRNNYLLGDSKAFGYPSLAESPGHPKNSPQSVHYPGTALLAMPGWLLGRRRWALLGTAVMAVLLIREMWLLCRALGLRSGSASVAVAMVTFTPPVLLLMRQIYPDVPAGLFLTHLARRLAEAERPEAPARRWPVLPMLTVAAVAGAAPWFHSRLIPGVALLLIVLAVRDRSLRILPLAAFAASLGVMGVAFQHWYGSPLPTAPYVNVPWRNPRPGAGLVGMLVDAHAGLLFMAPAAVVALVALPRLWQISRMWILTVGAAVGLAIAQNAGFMFWHAGYSTPARPWVPLLPVTVPLVALAVERIPRVMAAVGGWTALMAVAFLALPPLSYPAKTGLPGLWDYFHLTFLPVIDNEGRATHIGNTPVANCAVALVVLAVVLGVASRALWFSRPAGAGSADGTTRAEQAAVATSRRASVVRCRCAAPAARGGRSGRRRGSRSSWPA